MAKYELSDEKLDILIGRYPKFKKRIIELRDKKLEEINKRGILLDKGEDKITFDFLPRIYSLDLTLSEINEEEVMVLKKELNLIYKRIVNTLKQYSDLREEHYDLIAIWIIGTYMHDSFPTYPYLFLNAMRGSGKTRLLRLISSMSHQGRVLLSPTEAIMFRIPKGNTLCLDEMEGIMRKENAGLREMLNACYKKGSTVSRMKQQKTPDGSSEQIEERFEPYKPICMANIWGIEEVLGDRCVTIILEKSQREDIMRIIEDFDQNIEIQMIKSSLNTILVQLCSFFDVLGGIERWNSYIKQKYTTLHTHSTQTTQTTQTTPHIFDDLFYKMDKTGINGRNLELFFPLMLISHHLGEEISDKILQIAESLSKEKRKEEMTESKDVSVYDFVSKLPETLEYRQIRSLTGAFRNFLGNIEDTDDRWINERWFGRALKRLNLIVDKRRMAHGNEVVLDIVKAKKQMEMFR